MSRKTDATDLWVVIQVMEVTGALAGQKVCVTGHLSLPRSQIQGIIRQAGGEVHDNVKWNTTLLVSNADWTATTIKEVNGVKKSSKMVKAEENNRGCIPGRERTKIVSEVMFAQMIIDHGQASQMTTDQS